MGEGITPCSALQARSRLDGEGLLLIDHQFSVLHSADLHAHTAVGHDSRAHDEARAIGCDERDELRDLFQVRGAADWNLPASFPLGALSIRPSYK